jgi:hypothetical protein
MLHFTAIRTRLQEFAEHGSRAATLVNLALTLAIILFVIWRQPELLAEPRFWAEEGSNYFAFAFSHTWLENLFSPQFGYYTLYNSLATSLAASVPLHYSAYVTTYLAFSVQIAVSAAVIWWRIPVLDSLFKRIVVAFAIQFLAYARIWLTTIGVQYWLCVLSFLILLGETGTEQCIPRIQGRVLLVLNGLTGILSCCLIPAFILAWRGNRCRETLNHALILAGCLVVQVGIYVNAVTSNDPGLASRLLCPDVLSMLARFLHFQFVIPFFGHVVWNSALIAQGEAGIVSLLLPFTGSSIHSYNYIILQQLSGTAVVAFLAVAACKTGRRLETRVMVMAFAAIALVSNIFSVNTSGGPRYTFAPSVMIIIFLVAMTGWQEVAPILRKTALALVLIAVVMCDYRATMVFAYSPSWPVLRQELIQWQADPTHEIRVWPPTFVMKLKTRP